MDIKVIDGELFKELVLSGYNNLSNDVKKINDLNVFPVPDGDTGTNMKKTLENGINNIIESENNSLSDIASSLAKGMLFGARGNSGVILSQYFKGIANNFKDLKVATLNDLVSAFIEGYKTAYKAVVNPEEGTILTVARESIEDVKNLVSEASTINELIEDIYKRMKTSVEETPEKLYVLKEAGVVDSGGAGLLAIFEGMLSFLKGNPVKSGEEHELDEEHIDISSFNRDSELSYGYDTVFILQLLSSKCNPDDVKVEDFVTYLSTIGDSIVAVKDEDIIKVHVHTKIPAKAIEFAQKFGEFITFKLENMTMQTNEVEALKKKNTPKKHKKTAVVGVATGDGVIDAFTSLNCDIVLNGGQTMNTSCEEFIEAFDSLDADNIIVLPDNKNILLAAKQAKNLYKKANIEIIPTSSFAEGYFALTLMIDPDSDIKDQVASMSDGLDEFKTGIVTYATRKTHLNNFDIELGDKVSLIDHDIVYAGNNRCDAIKAIIDSIEDFEDKSIVTIFIGQHGDGLEALKIKDYILSKNKYIDIGIINGQQDVYDYVLGIY